MATSGFAKEISHKDWPTAEKWEDVLAEAKKDKAPIVMFYGMSRSEYSGYLGCAHFWMNNRSLRGMKKIFVHSDRSRPSWASNIRGQVDQTYHYGLSLYFVTPEKLKTIGFVCYSNKVDIRKVAPKVNQVMKWINQAGERIEAADKIAEQGRFRTALTQLEKIEKEDIKVTATTEKAVGRLNKIKEGQFFGKLVEPRLKSYEKIGQKLLKQAQAELEAGEHRKALNTLKGMLASKNVVPSCAEAAKLKTKIIADMRKQSGS